MILNAALLPVIAALALLAAGAALIIGIVKLFSSSTSEADEAVKAETKTIEASTEKLKEQADAYDNLKAKRQDAGYEAIAEAERNKKNWEELQKLNEQESLSAEQKERMKFLVGELNGELDTNIQLTEKGNKLVGSSIQAKEFFSLAA